MSDASAKPAATAVLPDVVAYVFDGEGGARQVDVNDLVDSQFDVGNYAFAWVCIRRDQPHTFDELTRFGLDGHIAEALTADETRPRCTVHRDGVVLNLRGVNLEPGEVSEDMVSARFWVEGKRVIGVWVRPLMAMREMFDAIDRGQAPTSPGDLVAQLALRLTDGAEPAVATLNERIDDLEELVLDQNADVSQRDLVQIRRTSIELRRYLFPQRDALSALEVEDLPWLGHHDQSRIREAADRVTRLGEELDAVRDRAQVIHDQIMDKRAEMMNRQMLVLSIVAALFLPLGLLTGLLGVNVGGIPGASDPWGFWVVCALLVVLGAAQLWFFRKIGMLK
ncbi:MAG: zinc transporter ZntB [Hyphomicrobiales bacterium]|nr:MAG: zinc transporter ZntB [Hyphomicrobiales bacterium]